MDAKKLLQKIKEDKKPTKVMLNVRVDEALRAALLRFAKDNGVSATQVVEALLKDLLEPQKSKK